MLCSLADDGLGMSYDTLPDEFTAKCAVIMLMFLLQSLPGVQPLANGYGRSATSAPSAAPPRSGSDRNDAWHRKAWSGGPADVGLKVKLHDAPWP